MRVRTGAGLSPLPLALAAILLAWPAGGAGEPRLALDWEIPSTCNAITLSAHADARGRPYLYVGAKDAGLRVYDIAGKPRLVATVDASALAGLHVMNVEQHDTLLLLALGNTFGTAVQSTGLALVDVADAAHPRLRGVWHDRALHGGSGMAVTDGAYTYLGAMGNGVIVLDVRDRDHPREVSRFLPAPDWPDRRPDRTKVNARGLQLAGARLYVSYDAGGLRILDVADPGHLRELGRWSNPALAGRPRAYNNAVVDGDVAYVSFDYCGIEVLDVADPARPRLLHWWNPWRCETGLLNWFSSQGHVNEIALDRTRRLLFAASGMSDLQVLDVSRPDAPRHVLEYGGVSNGIGTWGVSIHGDEVYLTYTCALIPFPSAWTGVKALRLRD